MSRVPQTITFAVLMLLAASSANAQHHHIPNISGRYTEGGPDICTIVQDGRMILMTARNPGVSLLEFRAFHGRVQYLTMNGRLNVQRMGFYGRFCGKTDDGRTCVEGTAALFPTNTPGTWEMIIFKGEPGNAVEIDSGMIARTGPLRINQGTAPVPVQTVRPQPQNDDEFGLESDDNLVGLDI